MSLWKYAAHVDRTFRFEMVPDLCVRRMAIIWREFVRIVLYWCNLHFWKVKQHFFCIYLCTSSSQCTHKKCFLWQNYLCVLLKLENWMALATRVVWGNTMNDPFPATMKLYWAQVLLLHGPVRRGHGINVIRYPVWKWIECQSESCISWNRPKAIRIDRNCSVSSWYYRLQLKKMVGWFEVCFRCIWDIFNYWR